MKTYNEYLDEVKAMLRAGHNRSDILKVLKTTYLFNQDEGGEEDELGALIYDIEHSRHEKLFKEQPE